ncbi:hypothetical protein Zmor_021702 [Zophobas morio]|uniref:Uncharacterized protein n=1 Tax=Zophobas morio TaxID=2755281 RepID=A0AA38MB90_9CUCU|nr:hypothetical protein Zmor_021702 [Zophobas morio]
MRLARFVGYCHCPHQASLEGRVTFSLSWGSPELLDHPRLTLGLPDTRAVLSPPSSIMKTSLNNYPCSPYRRTTLQPYFICTLLQITSIRTTLLASGENQGTTFPYENCSSRS